MSVSMVKMTSDTYIIFNATISYCVLYLKSLIVYSLCHNLELKSSNFINS